MTARPNVDDVQEIIVTLGPRTVHHELRAFSAACCRRVWEHLEPESRAAVETVEAWLEGRATDEDLASASQQAADALVEAERRLDIRIARNGHLYHAAFAAAACAWTPGTRFDLRASDRDRVITSPLEAASMTAAQAASARAVADSQAPSTDPGHARGDPRGGTAGIDRTGGDPPAHPWTDRSRGLKSPAAKPIKPRRSDFPAGIPCRRGGEVATLIRRADRGSPGSVEKWLASGRPPDILGNFTARTPLA